MQRRAFQGLFLTSLKHISNIQRRPPCSCFHLSKSRLYSDESSWKAASVETKTDFSDLKPDEFGTLRPHKDINEIIKNLPAEEDEEEVFDETNEEGRKNRRPLEYYEKMIKDLIQEKKIVEALDVMETRMFKRDKVHPGYYIYNLLINGCARVGYPLKAFKLYKSMRERNIKTTPATYTGLFNACANSPFPKEALIKLNHLRKVLAENSIELNLINYNAMIKAYARLEDIHAAFLVVDEMLYKGFSLQDDTCCFLLQACISDKTSGLRHALLVWHKMRAKKLTPNVYHYNLLMRCIRDCGLGGEDEVKDVIQKILLENTPMKWNTVPSEETKELGHMITSEQGFDDSLDSVDKNLPEVQKFVIEENRPNLLNKRPHLGNILAVRDVKTPTDRLLLLGGFKTVLQQMKEDKVKPDIKIFTQLLNIMPSSVGAENHLMNEIKEHGVDLDIDFCNMLMKQRASRRDYEGAKEVLNLIQSNYLNPDIVTFGVLAMSCQKIYQAEELINNMRDFGYMLNIEILGAMLHQACVHLNFEFVIYLMRLMRNLKIKPNKKCMEFLQFLDERMNKLLKQKKRRSKSLPEFMNNSKFLENYLMFKEYYDKWKTEVTVFVPPHPYKQFKEQSNIGSESTLSNKKIITKKRWNESKKQMKPDRDNVDDESCDNEVENNTEK